VKRSRRSKRGLDVIGHALLRMSFDERKAVGNKISYATDKDRTEIRTVTRVTFRGLRTLADLLMERASTVELR
jgi:hypothetical protein